MLSRGILRCFARVFLLRGVLNGGARVYMFVLIKCVFMCVCIERVCHLKASSTLPIDSYTLKVHVCVYMCVYVYGCVD